MLRSAVNVSRYVVYALRPYFRPHQDLGVWGHLDEVLDEGIELDHENYSQLGPKPPVFK